MNLYKLIPTFILGPMTQIFSYISSIGIQVKLLGVRQFEFGSCVITNIGSIGIENSLVPIPPVSFAPAILTLCSYYKRNVKDDNDKINKNNGLLDFLNISKKYYEGGSIENYIKYNQTNYTDSLDAIHLRREESISYLRKAIGSI